MEIHAICYMQEWNKEYVENFKWAFDKECIWSSMGGVEGTLDDGLTKFKCI